MAGENGSRPQIQIVLCGPKSSGKTVYLTTIFGRASNMKTANDQTTQLLQADWKKLESGVSWPAATSLGVRELAFTYFDANFRVNLNINDYDGQLTEVLSLAEDESDLSENLGRFREMVRTASGLIFLFPFGEQTDDDRMRKFRDEINTFLSLVEQGGVNWEALSIPVVIAVNKWDRAPEFGKPDEASAATRYLESTPVYRDAVARLRTFLPNNVVIPISTQRPSEEFSPARPDVEPHNLLEPLRYIINSVFSKFEQEYAALSDSANEDSEKQRFLLLNAYHREIQSFKSYGQEYDAVERRIGDRFQAAFAGLEAREIDERMGDEAWYFDAVRSTELQRRFEQLRFGALVDKFKAGLENARGSAADLDIFRKENAWLFERLSEHPEYEQSYQAAVARVASVERTTRLKRIGITAAAIPAALFLIWMIAENVVEGRRYEQVVAMRADPANFARCERASRYIADYESGFRPPLFLAGDHLREAREIETKVHNEVASLILARIDFFRSGQAAQISSVAQEFNAIVQANDRCLPDGQMIGSRSPREELRALSEPLQDAVTFVERSTAAPAPPQGCSDITSLASQSASISVFAQDVELQRQRIRGLNQRCETYQQCNEHRSNARSAPTYAEFRSRLASDNISACLQAQAEQMFPEGLPAAFGEDRDQTYARLDNEARSRLVTSFTSGAQLDETRSLIADMRAALSPFGGVAGTFARTDEVTQQMQRSSSAISEYTSTQSMRVRTIALTANSGTGTSRNPLNFTCSVRESAQISGQFGSLNLPRTQCDGSGSYSTLTWGVSNFSVTLYQRLTFAPQRPRGWDGRSFYMPAQSLEITRDHIYQLKASGQTVINVPSTAYTITLTRE